MDAIRKIERLSDNDTITNIIAWVDSRIEAEVRHRPDVNVYKRILSETWSQVRNHLVSLRSTPVDPPAAWRCFHCDESFLDQKEAALHFGTSIYQSPACQIDIAEYRNMEERVRRANEDDSDTDRAMYRQRGEHSQTLIREEEKGYARGLADGAPYLAEREQTLASKEAELAEAGLKYVSLFGELQNAMEEIARLKSALNGMLTHMGMDEDEWNKPTFDQARAALRGNQ